MPNIGEKGCLIDIAVTSEVLSWTKTKAFSTLVSVCTQAEFWSLVHRSTFCNPEHLICATPHCTQIAVGEYPIPSSVAHSGSASHFTCEAVIKNLLVLLQIQLLYSLFSVFHRQIQSPAQGGIKAEVGKKHLKWWSTLKRPPGATLPHPLE